MGLALSECQHVVQHSGNGYHVRGGMQLEYDASSWVIALLHYYATKYYHPLHHARSTTVPMGTL